MVEGNQEAVRIMRSSLNAEVVKVPSKTQQELDAIRDHLRIARNSA